MTSIFISYSRRDIDTAEKIVSALSENKLDTWIDWRNIPKGEDWQQEIYRGIEEAETFLFLVSPDSVKSEPCNKEIEHAIRNNKRIIPIVIRDAKVREFTDQRSGKEISRRNWIFCRDEKGDFRKAIEETISTIHTDYEWLKYHTALQVKALEWDRTSRENSFFLHGKELSDAEAELAMNSSKEPYPTDLQREYVFKSRQAADKQRRKTTSLAVAGTVALAILAVIALLQAGRATKQASIAQTAQAQAEERATIARAGELTALSVSEENLHFDRSLLFGVKAWQTWKNSRTELTLLGLMTRNPNLQTYLYGHQDTVSTIAYSPNGKIVASGSYDRTVILWDVSRPSHAVQLSVLAGHTDHINSIAFSPDGSTLASGSDDHRIILWDVSNPKKPQKLSAFYEETPVLAIDFHPSGHILASGISGGSVNLWNVGKPHKPSIISSPGPISGDAESVAFSRDGNKLAVGQGSGLIGIWEIHNPSIPAEAFSFRAYDVPIYSVAFNKDGGLLASGSEGQVAIWDVSNPGEIDPGEMGRPLNRTFLDYAATARRVAFSPEGDVFAAGGDNKALMLWDGTGVFPLARLEGQSAEVYGFAFSPDGETLVSGGADGNIILWDIDPRATPLERFSLRASDKSAVNIVCLSSDGKKLASIAGNSIVLWELDKDPPTGHPLSNPEGVVRALVFSPDDRVLASETTDGIFRFWNVHTGDPIPHLPDEYQDWAEHLNYGPDGKTLLSDESVGNLATLSPGKKGISARIDAGQIVLWDVVNHKAIRRLPISGIRVSALELSPSGTTLIVGEDTKLSFWDISTDQPIGVPQFEFAVVYSYGTDEEPRIPVILDISFTQDGDLVALGLGDGRIALLNYAAPSWSDKLCQRAGRNFTQAEWSQYFPDQQYEITCPQYRPGE